MVSIKKEHFEQRMNNPLLKPRLLELHVLDSVIDRVNSGRWIADEQSYC